MGFIYETKWKAPQEPTWLEDVIGSAFNECSELRVTPFDETFERIVNSVKENERFEIRALIDNTVGGVAIITFDYDCHIGESMTVQWNYVKPEYRNLGMARFVLRKLREGAKSHNLPFSYTQRIGEGKYSITYNTGGKRNG